MTIGSFLLLLLLVLLWGILLLIRSLHVRSPVVTEFELNRKLRFGDEEARSFHDKRPLYPRLQALKKLCDNSLFVALVICCVLFFGAWAGVVVALCLSIILVALESRSVLRRHAARLFARNEASVFKLLGRWSWLDSFGQFTPENHTLSFSSKAELRQMIADDRVALSNKDKLHLEKTLDFPSVSVSDVMTPTSKISSVEQKETIGPLVLDQLHKTGHSRFPVIDGDIDHIIGVLYLRDIVTSRTAHKTVQAAMKAEVYYIPEDQSLDYALYAFLRSHHHLFIVFNESRDTVGIITLNDVIEALLGEISTDTFDQFDDLYKVAEHDPHSNNELKGNKNS